MYFPPHLLCLCKFIQSPAHPFTYAMLRSVLVQTTMCNWDWGKAKSEEQAEKCWQCKWHRLKTSEGNSVVFLIVRCFDVLFAQKYIFTEFQKNDQDLMIESSLFDQNHMIESSLLLCWFFYFFISGFKKIIMTMN